MIKNCKNSKTNNLNKMKNIKVFVFIVSYLLFTSCQKVIDPGELPQQDARIVMNCILVSDSFIVANISASKSILSGKPYSYLSDAFCSLYENDVFKTNLISRGDGNFTSSVLAKVNTKYSLKVSANGYKDVQATTSVPARIAVTNIARYDTVNSFFYFTQYDFTNPGISGSTKYKLNIIDDVNQKNYYSIRPFIQLYDSLGKEIVNPSQSLTIVNNINTGGIFGGDNYGDGLTVDVDDKNVVNGKEIPLDLSVSFYLYDAGLTRVKKMKLYLSVYSLSEDFYRYKYTLNEQSYNEGLFSEPVRVFSNVSSGMGIMAGWSVNTFEVYSGSPKKQ
jgi:hypothetical protein